MTQWYVKELSEMTHISVQTLHHYDHIDLLKPSIRLANGYRLYSKKDLLKLQQIIALKYFGFSLSQIKKLLSAQDNMIDHLSVQSQLLEAKAQSLLEASQTLKTIISDCIHDKSIEWSPIVKLIEVYRMTQNLENAWVKDILSQNELKEYAKFESELIARSTPESKMEFETKWHALVEELQQNLKQDPKSEVGIGLGKRCLDLINAIYGKKYAHLRTVIFEKGFVQGKGLKEVGLTPEIVFWLDKALDAYWQNRIHQIYEKIGKVPSSDLKKEWDELQEELHGSDSEAKSAFIQKILNEDKMDAKTRKWLQELS